MARIFISYRRDDSAGHAGRLFDRLSDHFGLDNIFMDVDTIAPGQDFVDAVRQAVSGCDGLVAIIGREWLTIPDATGARRLEDPEDLVRLEIATALERGIRVVPVLVQGARMPGAADFPEGMKELARRNAQEISDRRFHSDVQRLIEALEAPLPEKPGNGGFVGREREMGELNAALDDAISGHGRLVMLAGEPGIGKTRTAQELASHAETLGARVLWGWCYEREGAPPYWPWVQPVRSYVQATDAEQLRSQMGPGAADIGEVIPELREKLQDLGPPLALDPDQARFRLFDSFATFFKNAAQIQPMMLVLEDLHWADKPSLLLLEFLARQLGESRFLVLGTYRDADVTQENPMSESLAQLRRSPVFRSTVLGALESGQIGQFIQAASGGNASQEMIDAIYAHTEGNPFFMTEVIRLLDERGELEEASGTRGPVTLGIPQGVLEVIGQRLNRLSGQCNGVLTTVAVAGRQFDFKLLELLNDQVEEIQLLELMDEALGARVIEEAPGQRDRYQFSHALMQQTLLGRLSTSRRVRLHALAGEVLEKLYEDRVEDRAAELAYHFAEAEPVLGPAKLVRYSLLAGERALSSFAYEEALGHFQRGVFAKGMDLQSPTPVPDKEAADLLFGLGRSQAATHGYLLTRFREAVGNLKRAFEFYRQAGEVKLALQVAQYTIRPWAGHQSGMTQVLEAALELVAPDSLEAARLQAVYGRVIGFEEGRYDEAQQAFSRALAIAAREEDAGLEMRTLANAAHVHYFQARFQEALQASLQSIQLSQQVDDWWSELSARYIAALTLRGDGNLEDSVRQVDAMLPLAEKVRDHLLLMLTYWMGEISSAAKGDWEAARSFSDKGLDIAPEAPTLLSTRIWLEYELGEFAKGSAYLKRFMAIADQTPPGPTYDNAAVAYSISLVARITGVPDNFAAAHKAAKTVLSSPRTIATFTLVAETGLALIAVIEADVAACQDLYARLKPSEGFYFVTIVGDRILGLLSHTMGKPDQAAAHFEDALAFCRKDGYRPELAWTCCDYADTLVERNNKGDRAKANALLDESLAISSELGMRPLMERVQSRKEQLKADG